MKENIHNCSSNKSWNFSRFYRRAKIFINKYFVEGKLLPRKSEGHLFFFFWKYIVTRMKRYFNDGQQWKKLLQNENLYQVLGNECFDKFFIEHQLFRKQHCARAINHVSCSVCVAKKLRVVQVTVILRCFSSSQRVRNANGNFFFWKFKKQFFS